MTIIPRTGTEPQRPSIGRLFLSVVVTFLFFLYPQNAAAIAKPKVKKVLPPAGAPADNRYFEIETDGVDENTPIDELCTETSEDIDGQIASNGDDGIPKGWTSSVRQIGEVWFICFKSEENVMTDVIFKICVAPLNGKKGRIDGTGAYKYFTDDGDLVTSGGGAGKIVLSAYLFEDGFESGDTVFWSDTIVGRHSP